MHRQLREELLLELQRLAELRDLLRTFRHDHAELSAEIRAQFAEAQKRFESLRRRVAMLGRPSASRIAYWNRPRPRHER